MEKDFVEEIKGLMGKLNEAVEDAARFNRGDESAGVRVRNILKDVAGGCKHQRLSMLAVSAERREAKCS